MNHRKQDRMIFKELIRFLDKKRTLTLIPGQLILEIGNFFLGMPYVAGTLETKREEHLSINLRGFDCVTFVENIVALTWYLKSREKSFEAFRRILLKIRYRQGRLQGYSSRLHYFSDWIYDNQKKGMLRDITAEIGGKPLKKAINFMTTHPDFYSPLKEVVNLRRMKSVERSITKRSRFFIPKEALRYLENKVCGGDLIAVTTNIEGLDVQHVGLAARVKNRIHLLNASSVEGKVVLSPKTLYGYLMQSRSRSGIMVARVA